MKHLVVLPEHTYAGYCSTGANKDWAACLALETDDQKRDLPVIRETTEVVYLSLHGPHGGNMIIDRPKILKMKQALTHFTNKCREKDNKGYQHVPFVPYLPAFGRPLGLSLTTVPNRGGHLEQVTPATLSSETEPAPTLPYQASVLKAAPLEKLHHLLTLGTHGVSEKANGERCIIVFEGAILRAYNRRGKLMSAPPIGARHLCRLGCSFVIDGERLMRDQAGSYVAFDLLEWNKKPFTSTPYMRRIMTLEGAMYQAGLLREHRSTPTLAQACANSTVDRLALLIASAEALVPYQVVSDVQASRGEGIVVRAFEADYATSPLKYKFVEDIDAFVIGIKGGVAEGSLKLAVVRPTDGAIIEIGNVRSGFVDADIRTIRHLLERKEHPVFRVTYLPASTIGIQLVEPRSGMAFLRHDKDAVQYTTDQFGPEKAPLIAQAKPVEGIVLP